MTAVAPEAPARWDVIGRTFRRSPRRRPPWLVMFGMLWLVLVAGMAVLAPILPLPEPGEIAGRPRMAPFSSAEFPLGTDSLGRDQLARLVIGARSTIVVGVSATAIGIFFGLVLGLVAGFFRGKVERLFDLVMDCLLAFPPLILLLALTSVMTPSITNLVLALSLLAVPSFARVTRANTILFANREFVDASRVLGATPIRIIVRDLLPNVLVPAAGVAFIGIAALTVAEGSLSFLGLGIPPPTPSWGGMMAAGRNELGTTPLLVLLPAAMLFFSVLSLNILGDWTRERLDSQQATK